ncbi:MFS family permease [Granulicella aggregans]|uniref:MFS family permease n=1 Tax=Granulicella aggregans TaxID=474949 RepID=A0A7W7ZFD7_9BACT|nr:MFS transporter [Granulicella aggregans]MBB5058797.1 MFS family permease [Granulicella aggregans]
MTEGSPLRSSPAFYSKFLLCIAGLGGLLYGIDVGISSAALLYLTKTVDLTVSQTSIIVAAVFGGSTVSSLIAGFFADWVGRRKMVIVSGFLFAVSVAIIVLSHGFVPLLVGRLLQGLSGGVIAVVVPLYLAECLSAGSRGKGSGIFQFMLTFGIVAASLTGLYFIHQAEATIAAAGGNAALIRAAQDHAWRSMFLAVIYPGLAFFIGAFFLSETPRWLFKKGRLEEASAALRRAVSSDEADREMREMQELALEDKQHTETTSGSGSLLQRKYVYPFLLACVILTLNQTTGINSVLGYLLVILKQAGMTATHAAQGDLTVKVLNCLMTIVGVTLVDRKGRKFLLSLGTGGIVVAVLGVAFFFYAFESHRIDISQQVNARIQGNTLSLSASDVKSWSPQGGSGQDSGAMGLSILYSYGSGDKLATLVSTDSAPLAVAPEVEAATKPLIIRHAFLSRIPAERTGWFVTAFLALFIASYAAGPGVVVWLALSELMPTRIRSAGMGIALLLNQGASTLIAGVFLPAVANFGYFSMFLFWGGCTTLYFCTAIFFLPETKGKTLEEIERNFDPARA